MTNKEIIIKLLKSKEMSRGEIVAAARDKHGSNQRSIGRRLSELASEGRVVKVSESPPRYALADAPKISISQTVEYERKIRVLNDDLRDTKKKYREALREGELESKLISAIGKSAATFDPVSPPTPVLKPKTATQESVCVLLSDLHHSEVVVKEEVGGLGEYNVEIAQAYIQNLSETVIDITQNHLLSPKNNIEGERTGISCK